MRNAIFAAALAAITSGCGGSEEIWVFYLDPAQDPVNEETITHNFNGAQVREGTTTTGGEWTYTETLTASPDIAFGQIVKVSGDDDAFLIINGTAIPGKKSGGIWVFEWIDSEVSTDREEHQTGYFTQVETDNSSRTTISMDLSGGTATGTYENEGTATTTYSESDTWDENATSQFSSDIPASSYLEYSDGSSVFNDSTLTDCTNGSCFLTRTQTTSVSGTFRAERTKYADEDAFDAVSGATNP